MRKVKLTIDRCSRHGFYAVAVMGERTGTRITPSKCCGSWSTIKAWSLSASEWRDIEREARKAAEAAEAVEKEEAQGHE